jgi:LysR family transcriptional regulator, benzoate and cis,cis-muconate-responsive activator of ben and cat genes
MELRTLRYFVETADAGTVSAAADAVHVTQPALSRQLRQLERELGTNLFDRVGGRLLLSPVGRELLPLARDVLTRAERLAVAAATLSQGRLERLMLAAPATTLADVVSPFIATLEEDDPTPSVFASDALEPQAALRQGADLVITNGRPGDQLDVLALAVLPVWAYVPAGHAWFGRDTVRLADLLADNVIGLPPTFTARQALDAAALGCGLAPRVVIEGSSGPVAQALAAAGRGVAVVSDDPRFALHPVRITVGRDELSIRLFAAWDHHHPAATTLAMIAQRLSMFIVRRYGESTRPPS